MLIHSRKELAKLKRYSKWKQLNELISIPVFILLLIAAVVSTVCIANEYLNYKSFILGRQTTELICYSIWCIISLDISRAFIRNKPESVGVKILALFLGALAATAVVLLINSFWQYLELNSMFGWRDPWSYWSFLKDDLIYSYHLGWIRYPAVFACVFIVGLILNSNCVVKLDRKIRRKVTEFNVKHFYIESEEDEQEAHPAEILPFILPDDNKQD